MDSTPSSMSALPPSGAGALERRALAALALLVLTTLAFWVWRDWQAALKDAGVEFGHVARTNTLPVALLARDARRLLESIDGSLIDGARPEASLLRRELAERFRGGEIVDFVPAGGGEPAQSTAAASIDPAVWREQFPRVTSAHTAVFGWAYERDGLWMLPVFYRRPDGSHIVVSLPVDSVVADWIAPNVGALAPMGMRGHDDRILMRQPFTPNMLGADASKSASAEAIRAAAARGDRSGFVVTPATETDSVVRLIAWAEVPGTGARVLVAASRSDLFSRWVAQRYPSHALALSLTIGGFLLVGWSRRRLKAAAQTESAARVAAERGAELMRHALDASRDTTWQLDLATGELSFDTDVRPLLGLPEQAPEPVDAGAGRALAWLLPHLDDTARSSLLDAVRRTCADRVGLYQELRILGAADGARHFILKGGMAPGAGRPLAVGTLRDVTRLVNSQAEAIQTLHTLERMCRLARIGPWSVDPRSGVIEMGPGARELYGLASGAPAGRWLDFPGADEREMPALMQARQRLLGEGVGYDLILPVRAGDGSQRWVRSAAVAVRGADGVIERIDGALQDVTDSERARHQLDASERRMRELALVVSSSSQLVLVTDAQQRITWCNASFERTSGYTLEELRGRLPGPLLQRGAVPDAVRERIRRAIGGRQVLRGQRLLNFSKTGQPYWIDLEIAPVYSEAGVLQSYIGLQTDVTEAIDREQALAKTKQRYELATHNARIGIWERDYVAREARWNNMMFELTGYAVEAGVPHGAPFHARVHEADRQATLDAIRSAAGDPAVARLEFECRFERSPGEFRWLRNQCVFERDGQGRAQRVVGTLLDVTVERELSRERQARAEADARSAAKTAFLSNMSHELRTPLNAVIGYAQIIGSAGPEDDGLVLERVKRIESAGWQLLALIDDVLDLARIEGGHVPIEHEPVALAEVLADVLDLIAPQAEARGIKVHCASNPVWVLGDVKRLRQVLSNLLSNAVKYNVDGGSIQVALDRRADGVRVEISDTGLGMTAAQQARLFQPFDRLGRENTAIQGTGIGLTITKTLVGSMGGTLDVASVPGHGTTFGVTLPAIAAPAPLAAAEATPATAARRPLHGALDVLCVEDNDVNALVLEESVRVVRPHWQVRRASSLEAAGRAVLERMPDVVILDQNLPDGHGLAWLASAECHAVARQAKVIMLTADALPETRRRALAQGIAWFLNKPFVLADLRALLDAMAVGIDASDRGFVGAPPAAPDAVPEAWRSG